MSWGGARVGSGPKPTAKNRRVHRPKTQLVAHPGGKPNADDPPSLLPPEDLPADQRPFWHRNASKAIAQGTLTGRTEEAFRLLCELDVERLETKKTIDRDGRTFIKVTVDGAGVEHQELKAHPLKGDYSRLSKQVENLMARFKLAPFGKAEAVTKPKAAPVSPWAQVAK